ncbi:MAG TPA: hypothetical protein VH255_08420, partial [Verrucomicrobiae bacterium]|nr:hypothetical protein [Verrucomicrobiae bacterium]
SGWGNKDRPGRWNPILIRASDPVPKNVTLQIVSPQPGGFARVIEEQFGIGPVAATFQLLAPSHFSPGQETIAVLRDTSTGKFLAQFPRDIRRPTQNTPAVGPHAVFVGISGTAASLDQLGTELNADFAYRPIRLLPRSALGYDSLEILLLNRPRFSAIDGDQQTAILDWVRAGGTLVLSPGDDVPAHDMPFSNALPCKMGQPREANLSNDLANDTALPPRFAHTTVYTLEPIGRARQLQLFKDSTVTAITAGYGLGQILVLPVDVNTLQVDQPSDRPAMVAIWKSLFKSLVITPKPVGENPRFAAPYYGLMSESPDQFREGAATATACDFLYSPSGTVPRQWPHVALILLGIFTVVGPLDFLVMKMAGHSPWTWTTMVGWVAWAVLAVLCVSSLSMHRPASLKTIRLVDQSDDGVVATTDLVGVDSIGRTPLQLTAPPTDASSGWWEPILPGSVDPRGGETCQNLAFHENDASCLPEAVPGRPQGPRFFRRQVVQAGGSAILAKLAISREGGLPKLVGTIQNLLQTPVRDIRIRTSLGVVLIPIGSIGALTPGQTINVSILATGEPFIPAAFENRYQDFGYYGSRTDTAPVREQDLWALIPDLVGRRSLRIDGMLESDAPVAVVYAQCLD